MRTLASTAALMLILAACGGDGGATTTTEALGGSSTQPPAPTTTGPIDVTTTTGTDPTTTTSNPTPTGPTFVITQVGLGDSSMVVITNIGDETGNLGGHWLCQRPAYFEFSNMEVGPGESVAIATSGNEVTPPEGVTLIEGTATVGSFDPEDGEIGLYNARSFGSSNAILSYVEWGESGHGRSGTAVSAGIWPDDGFVATSAATTTLIATDPPAISPDGWTAS